MSGHMAEIQALLRQHNIYDTLFDIIRIVDPEKGSLMEYGAGGGLRKTDICCTDVFGSNERCRNCTSTRAYYSDKTMVKLEYAGGAVLLIFSVPLRLPDKRVVVEMVKNISDSMTLDIKDKQRLDGVTSIISNLNRLSITDALTGLFNRRYLDDCLPELIGSCHRVGQPMCLALLDLDDFKQINDARGHQAGDMVLAATGDSVLSFVRRGSDWGARYGGEEMLVCFVGVKLAEGVKILERIRQHVEENLVIYGEHSLSVTVSVGLAELHAGEGMADIIKRCDKLLYQAKRKGKNRVEYINEETRA